MPSFDRMNGEIEKKADGEAQNKSTLDHLKRITKQKEAEIKNCSSEDRIAYLLNRAGGYRGARPNDSPAGGLPTKESQREYDQAVRKQDGVARSDDGSRSLLPRVA